MGVAGQVHSNAAFCRHEIRLTMVYVARSSCIPPSFMGPTGLWTIRTPLIKRRLSRKVRPMVFSPSSFRTAAFKNAIFLVVVLNSSPIFSFRSFAHYSPHPPLPMAETQQVNLSDLDLSSLQNVKNQLEEVVWLDMMFVFIWHIFLFDRNSTIWLNHTPN